MPSLRKNIIYKGLLTFSNYIIGFITFPYITRILGPNNFGLVNFVINTIDYFLLFATLGITTIGTREIAAAREDREVTNQVFSRILGLNGLCTIITLIIYFACILLIPAFRDSSKLFFVGSAKIIFTLFSVEWFFTGIENFRYITIRSLIIKSLYVILVFILVNQSEDYYIYFILTIGVVVINSVVNFGYAFRFVSLIPSELKSKVYFKQNLQLGIYAIMTSMYITFNVMFLGIVCNNEEVGFYSAAVKLYFIGVSLFGAFTSVMLPRVSSLAASNMCSNITKYIHMSFKIVAFTAIPIIFIGLIYAPEIIYILSGDGYTESVTPMRIIMPATVLVWSSLIMVYQGFIPLHKDGIILRASICAGILALSLNIILTPNLGAIGSALVLLACEICVTIYYVYKTISLKIYKFPKYNSILRMLILSIPYLLICGVVKLVFSGLFALLIAIGGCGIYLLVLHPLKQIKQHSL